MHSSLFKARFDRFIEVVLSSKFLVFYFICNPVFTSAVRFRNDSASVGEILLNVAGGPFAAVSPENEISQLCIDHSRMYLQELSNFAPWAINMYDASTNIPSGLVTGNIQQLGNFEQCLNIEVRSNDRLDFRGQQCRATVQFAVGGFSKFDKYRNTVTAANSTSKQLDMKDLFYAVAKAADVEDWKSPISAPYTWALCVPSTCSAADVESALNEALLPLNVPGRIEVTVSVQPANCVIANMESPDFTAPDIVMISLLSLVALFVIASTSYDVIIRMKSPRNKDKSARHAVLMSFSLYTNCGNLLSTSTSSDTMSSLNGLRFLSIFWILLGHTFYMKSISPNVNHITVKYYDQSVSKMLVMNATLTTDTFFLLSGILLCYIFMRDWNRNSSFNLGTFYLHRYLRLTPPYAFVILFYSSFLYYLGSGPLWDTWVGVNRDYCIANWWTNLLYVNNYVNVADMCMNQTWYLAVDMQLFWLSPLVLLPLAKWPRFGKGFLATIIFVSVVIPFAITFSDRLTALMLYTKEPSSVSAVYIQIYTRTYARAGPYLIGIALGYLLHTLKDKTIHIRMVWVIIGWVVSLGSCAAVVFGAAVFYNDNHEYNAFESSMYAGLHRSVWALCVAWMAFACIKGYGGPVDVFLSWKLFTPLSRLTYCSYLSHYIVLLVNIGGNRAPGYLSEYTILHEFAGNLVLTLVLAAIISVVFEIPFMNLDRILIRRQPSGSPTRATEGTSAESTGLRSNSLQEGNALDNKKMSSVYVIPSHGTYTSTVPMELKSYENAGFEESR